MFLNKFWDWAYEGDMGPIFLLTIILIAFGSAGVLVSRSIFWILLAIALWIALSEWMYFDYVNKYKKPKDLGLVKFGCLVGTIPFVAVPIAILVHWNIIIGYIIKVMSSPEMHKVAFYTLVLAIIIIIIVSYFRINILIAKKIIKNNNKKQKKGGK